jgi:hypothetical protein
MNINDVIDGNLKSKFRNSTVLQLLDSDYIFESFSDTKPIVMKSQAKPIEFSINVRKKNSQTPLDYRILYKTKDDLRKDFYVIQSLELMNEVGYTRYFTTI